jgi:hypothetical protein
MPNPTWPSDLPAYVLQQGYGEDFQDQVLRTPMEGGATKGRRRFTGRFDVLDVRLMMTAAQVATFETFLYTTLAGGVERFDWTHPRKQTAATMKIVSKVKVDPADGDNFTVSFKVEVQP